MAAFAPFLPTRRVCLNCLRRSIEEDYTKVLGRPLIQVRGKKKMVVKNEGMINVRLLKDIKGYGRKGTITPVAPGRMRNSWYPQQQAEYLATAVGIDPRKVVSARDFTFGFEEAKRVEEIAPSAIDEPIIFPLPRSKTQLLAPQLATEILSDLLPPNLIFSRSTIVSEPFAETPETPSGRATSHATQEIYAAPSTETAAAEDASPASEAANLHQPIFGSVSTLDIATSIKDILSNSETGKRVVVGAEEITILADSGEGAVEAEGYRLKTLGDFPIEIRVKGGEVVKRTVSIRPPPESIAP